MGTINTGKTGINAQTPPDPLKKGPKWARDAYNNLLQFAICIRPLPGAGQTSLDGPDGRMMNASATSAPTASDAIFPFKLVAAGAGQIRVVYGTINGTAPDGFSPGDNPQFVVSTVGSTGFVYLEVTTDSSGNITDRSIGVAATVPADTSGDYHFEVGSYSITDGVMSIAQAISGSQMFELCGLVEPLWGLV